MTRNEIYIRYSLLARMIICVAVLAAVLVSCSPEEDEGKLTASASISFGGATVADEEGNTRAGSETALKDYVSTFIVYGYKTGDDNSLQPVFPGYLVNYTNNDWVYDGLTSSSKIPQTLKFWDTSALEYRYFAIAPYDPKLTMSGTGANPRTCSLILDATTESSITSAPYISDLWVTSDVASCVNNPVKLTFKKPFCKVRIMFVNEAGTQYSETSSLSMGDDGQGFAPTTGQQGSMITKGTVTLSYPVANGASKEYAMTTTNTTTLSTITEPYEIAPLSFATTPQKWHTLIPPGVQGTYSLKATVGGNQKTVVVPAEYMQWKAGYAYTYVFKISDSSSEITLIKVIQVGVKSWTEEDPEEHPLFNW